MLGCDGDFFAVDFYQLIGKRLLFKIEISEYNITTGWNVYTILRMCYDDSIIQEMIQKDVVNVVFAISKNKIIIHK